MKKPILSFILIILIFCALLCGCGKMEPVSKTDIALDTIVSITIYDVDSNVSSEQNLGDLSITEKQEIAYSLIEQSINLTKHYEKLFSAYDEESDIYKINHGNGQPVLVDITTIELVEKGIEFSKLSDGAFDITCGALNELWHISDNTKDIPSKEEIATALETIDYNNIVIDKSASTIALKNPDTHIDLGAVAKGYIADELKKYLVENGVSSGMINLGGNVLMIGGKLDDNALIVGKKHFGNFNVGIAKPFSPEEICYTVSDKDKSVVTSGNYQRYFEKDGKIYHHIMDLSTGYPSDSGISSATVISDKSLEGDALSTICFILGKDKGEAFINAYNPDIKVHWEE